MSGLCTTVGDFGGFFLLLAAGAAIVETMALLSVKLRAFEEGSANKGLREGFDADGWAKALEALKGLLLALKELPAWFALFLAGLALVWTASSAPHLCA